MTDQVRTRRGRRTRNLGVAVLALLTVLAIPSGVALAHTSFVGSTPEDGATVADPVSTITLAFSGDSEPAGDGFTVLTPDGEVRTPTTALTVDQRVFTLTFDPPLAGGTVGVRWSVKAPDKHPIDGAFSFTVTAPAPAVAPVPVSSEVVDVVATTTAPTSAPLVTDASAAPADTMAMADGSTMTDAPPDTMVMADGSTMAADVSMDEFLAVSPTRPGEGTARSGRVIEFASLTLLVGTAAFAAATLRGRREEIERAIAAVRLLGAVLAVGALLEYVGIVRIAGASMSGYWSSSPGFATMLRVGAGVAIAAGFVAVTQPMRARRPAHSLSAAANPTTEYEREEIVDFWSDDDRAATRRLPTDRRPSVPAEPAPVRTASAIDPLLARRRAEPVPAAAIDEQATLTISTTPARRVAEPVRARRAPARRVEGQRHVQKESAVVAEQSPAPVRAAGDAAVEPPAIRRWVADQASLVGFIGIGVAIISFWFDGHTVSKGFRPLHAVVNSVHVIAGAVWIGGVVAMAVVLWSRHRAGIAPRALEMVVRFSGVAAVSLAAVLAAGGVMAFLILDSVGELFSTEWGKVLLLKSAAVGLALVGGAYNHFVLLPALEAEPDDPVVIERLRGIVTSEAILLGFVVVVTASLVSAAS